MKKNIHHVLQQFATENEGDFDETNRNIPEVVWPRSGPRFLIKVYIDPVEGLSLYGAYVRKYNLMRKPVWLWCPTVPTNVSNSWLDGEALRANLVGAKAELEKCAMIDDPWNLMRDVIPKAQWQRLRQLRSLFHALYAAYILTFVAAAIAMFEIPGETNWPPLSLITTVTLAGGIVYLLIPSLHRKTFAAIQRIYYQTTDSSNYKQVWIALWARGNPSISLEQDYTIVSRDWMALLHRKHKTKWWQTELSGSHAIIWVFLFFLLGKGFAPELHLLPFENSLLLVVLCLCFLKAGYWLFWMNASPATRIPMMRRYQWLGTLRGTMAACIGILLLVGACTLILKS